MYGSLSSYYLIVFLFYPNGVAWKGDQTAYWPIECYKHLVSSLRKICSLRKFDAKLVINNENKSLFITLDFPTICRMPSLINYLLKNLINSPIKYVIRYIYICKLFYLISWRPVMCWYLIDSNSLYDINIWKKGFFFLSIKVMVTWLAFKVNLEKGLITSLLWNNGGGLMVKVFELKVLTQVRIIYDERVTVGS